MISTDRTAKHASRWPTLALVLGLAFGTDHIFAQPCSEEAFAGQAGKFSESGSIQTGPEATSTPPEVQLRIAKRLDSVEALFRQLSPAPRGADAQGHSFIERTGTGAMGSATESEYALTVRALSCMRRAPSGDLTKVTVSWAKVVVRVNTPAPVLQEHSELPIEGQPTKVWQIRRRTGELRGLPVYEIRVGLYPGRGVFLTRNGQYPWKPVSQKQFLEASAQKLDRDSAQVVAGQDEFVVAIEKQIEEVKKNLTGEMRDQVVAGMQAELARARAKIPADRKNLSSGVSAQIKVIRDYLARHSAQELAQPAVLQGGQVEFHGQFTPESRGGQMLVVANPAYFRADPTRAVPQLFAVLWISEDNAPAVREWLATFEGKFPFDRLRAMIDK